MKRILSLLLILLFLLSAVACGVIDDPPYDPDPVETDIPLPVVTDAPVPGPTDEPEETPPLIDEDGHYTTKEDVAFYIYTYGHLPPNFITKKEAQSMGWNGGGLERYMEDGCIGGTYFGNYEGLLPTAPGREYHECDIDTMGRSSRGAKRIVYSNDGLIYYTDDHYESFTLLYGED